MTTFKVKSGRVEMVVRKWCKRFHVSAYFQGEEPFCIGIYRNEKLAIEVALRWANEKGN